MEIEDLNRQYEESIHVSSNSCSMLIYMSDNFLYIICLYCAHCSPALNSTTRMRL